jgi:hypothetical protein
VSVSHRWRSAVTSFLVVMGLLTLAPAGAAASAEPEPTQTSLTLTASNPGPGVLRLDVAVSAEGGGQVKGYVRFDVDGRDPLWTAVTGNATAIELNGFEPHGSYHVTASFEPMPGSAFGGSASETSGTLSREKWKSVLTFDPEVDGRHVELWWELEAHPLAKIIGTITLKDLTEHVVLGKKARRVGAGEAGAVSMTPEPGVHRYRVIFTPLPRFADVLTGSKVTVDVKVGK